MFNKKIVKIVNIICAVVFIVYCFVGISLRGIYIDEEFFKKDIVSENVVKYSREFKGKNIYYTVKNNQDGTYNIQYVNDNEVTEYYFNNINDIEVYKNGEKILTSNKDENLDNKNSFEAFNIITIAHEEQSYTVLALPLLVAVVMFNIINYINITEPLYFFERRKYLWVKGGEPSELYIFMRDLGYVLIPVISIILMIMNIFYIMV